MFLVCLFILLSTLTLGSLGSPAASSPSRADGLVDLGYAKHIPTYIDTTASGQRIAVYKNIRFAKSPTGNLRFRAPDTQLSRVEAIQDGNLPQSTDCISSAPAFVPFPGINGTTWGREDCLFLDVYVPEGVRSEDNVPVLQNFYGSAYAFGSKDMFFSPMGLFDLMHEQNKGKFIVVANNYRLVSRFFFKCFGWPRYGTDNREPEWECLVSPLPITRISMATLVCSTASPRPSGHPIISTNLEATGGELQPWGRAPAPVSSTT